MSQSTMKPLKRMPRGSIRLQFAGDMVLARCDDPQLAGLFKRYQALFEMFANLERPERILAYKLINALMLTSYAKKADSDEEKHKLFDLKNNIFISLANDPTQRKSISLKYLVSKNFRVTAFCDECTKKNTEASLRRHEWKYCKNCKTDRDFYNVVAMSHTLPEGHVCIFLSNDLLHKIPFHKGKVQTGKLSDAKEEAVCSKYQYNARNLDAITYQSTIEMYERFVSKPASK